MSERRRSGEGALSCPLAALLPLCTQRPAGQHPLPEGTDVCVMSGMKSDETDLELLSMYTPGQQEFFHGLCREHMLHCDWCALLCTEGFKQLV